MSELSMRNLNLGFRFILEMVALIALFQWGFHSSSDSSSSSSWARRAGYRDGRLGAVRSTQGLTAS